MVATLSAISSKDEAAMAQENSTAAQTGDLLWVDKVCVSRLSCDGGVGAAVTISVAGLFDSMSSQQLCHAYMTIACLPGVAGMNCETRRFHNWCYALQ